MSPKTFQKVKTTPKSNENLTPEDRNTVENSDLTCIPSDFLKHQYPLKTQWDGSILGFNEYKSQMEGFYIQNRAWFMFDPNFRRSTVLLA